MTSSPVRGRPNGAGRGPLLLVLGAAVCAVIAVLGAHLAGGTAPVIRDSGPLVRYGAPVAAIIADIAVAMAFGGALLGGWVLERTEDRARAMMLIAPAAAVATVARLAALIVSYARATGQGIGSARFGSDLGVFIGTDLGTWMLMCTVFAAAATTLAVLGEARWISRGATALMGLAIFSTAMTGHAAGGDTHEVATSTMLVHLLAVGVWVGGLLVLQLLPAGPRDDARVIGRYSHLALIAWIALGLSGVWALAVRMTSPAEILTSAYVQLAVAKAALLLVLAGFGVLQRRELAVRAAAPARSAQARSAVAQYRRLAVLELALMGVAVALGAAMSSSPPPADAVPPAVGPAAVLSGYALPPAPTLPHLLAAWRPDPFGMALACAMLLGWWRPAVPARRAAASVRIVAAAALLVLVTSGPLNVYGKVLVSAHLEQHALLILCGILASSAFAPWRPDGLRARSARIMPVALALGPLLLLIAWYAWPPMLRAALDGHAMHLGLQCVALAAGWALAFGVRATERPLLLVVVALLLTEAVAAYLIWGDALLAPSWFGATGRAWIASAAADQTRGGIVLAVFTALVAAGGATAVVRERRRSAV